MRYAYYHTYEKDSVEEIISISLSQDTAGFFERYALLT